jgi:hypothetical protein
MRTPLKDCPRFIESELRDKRGHAVVNCGVCAFSKSSGKPCRFVADWRPGLVREMDAAPQRS